MTQEKIYNYPSEFVSKEEKATEAYGLKMFNAIYAEWNAGGLNIVKNRHTKIIRNRKYADGDQSIDIYKNQLRIKKNKSHLNLNWEIVAIIPKFLDVLTGYFEKLGENIVATALDPVAVERYMEDKALMEAEIALEEDLKWIDEMLGKSKRDDFKPRNNEELEIYMNNNYKQDWEMFLEEALYLVSFLNNLDTEVKREVIKSFLVDGMAWIKRYKENGKIKYRNVDVLEMVIGFSKKPDFSDIDKVGEIRTITIADLRVECQGKYSEVELEKIAEQNMGKNGNPKREYFYNKDKYGDFSYDICKINVLDLEYKTSNYYVWEKRKTRFGSDENPQYTMHEKPHNYNGKTSDSKEVTKKVTSVWYGGCWIIGSDYIYSYGPLEDQVSGKETLSDRRGSYHGYKPNNKPVIERMIPFADGIQLKWLKLQNAVARARVKGILINIDGLEEVPDGKGGVLTPLEVLEIFDQEGNMLYRAKDVDDPDQRNQFPMQELEGGIGKALQEFPAGINFDLEMLRQVSGVSEIMDAMLPQDPRQSATASKMAVNQTANTLQNIYVGWLSMKENISISTAETLQYMIKRGELMEGYVDALGSQKIRMIKVSSEISFHNYGIRIQAKPTDQEMQILEMEIQTALKQRSDTGQGGIELEDSFAIRQLMAVSVKAAEQLLIVRRNRRKKEDAEMQAAMAKDKSANDQQSAAVAAKMAQDALVLENNLKIDYLKAETEQKLKLLKEEHLNKLAEIALQNAAKQSVMAKQ